ncbi:bifunctional diaminohydroxyphosphoribosylaminopyrimidine deaminase/5-amino-6-(5-phosphoribosylamino)uracil reductase RibD [Nocardioides sp.]|uniref:bifunctional diaminohydroxyphosphoribosylaminopyrimidine deaminase/5-amino-6-(5-phosphoribosylamino)uracil reductase RibD n=1 Tax=Nocardioides sp. TaxID=35761 RepID=UPI0026028DD5|nr:bifunctional diaminohydroxyphosphoribosylaminopyrimidine deaminase/5-amino-6-(5-phosphoribosylamino)uracil reductase RibD [Nocardioides sp.]
MTEQASVATPDERAALSRALQAAAVPPGPFSPNPRVGCVLLDENGTEIAVGAHRGPGTAHAEVDAIAAAGERARGATAVVTLEPCHHTGRTGPCSAALIRAGVRRVVIAQRDPNPIAAGGLDALRAAGLEVVEGADAIGAELTSAATALNREWRVAVARRRPWVIWKAAATLDGRSAAADGTSRWITPVAARRDVHWLRARADTILVGTGTVLADDPSLTVRDAADVALAAQPLRAVMGTRPIPAAARVLDDQAATRVLATRDPHAALAALWDAERRHVFLEGGPTLAAAFLRARLVDEIVVYVAPLLLGAGPAMVGDLGVSTLADALRPTVTDVTILPGAGEDSPTVRFTLEPQEVAP